MYTAPAAHKMHFTEQDIIAFHYHRLACHAGSLKLYKFKDNTPGEVSVLLRDELMAFLAYSGVPEADIHALSQQPNSEWNTMHARFTRFTVARLLGARFWMPRVQLRVSRNPTKAMVLSSDVHPARSFGLRSGTCSCQAGFTAEALPAAQPVDNPWRIAPAPQPDMSIGFLVADNLKRKNTELLEEREALERDVKRMKEACDAEHEKFVREQEKHEREQQRTFQLGKVIDQQQDQIARQSEEMRDRKQQLLGEERLIRELKQELLRDISIRRESVHIQESLLRDEQLVLAENTM